MSTGIKQQELERQAQKTFSKEERAKQGQQRFIDEEERRRASNTAKTGRLRGQRLARDAAAEADAARVVTEKEPFKKKLRQPPPSSSQVASGWRAKANS